MSATAALSYEREGYRHQLLKLDTELDLITAPYNALIEFISSSRFLSELEEDYNAFMRMMSMMMTRVITSPSFASRFPSMTAPSQALSPVQPQGVPLPPPQPQPESKHTMLRFILAVCIVGAAFASTIFRPTPTYAVTNATSGMIVATSAGGGNEWLFLSFVIAGVILVGPELFEKLASRVVPTAKESKPTTVEAIVSETLGEMMEEYEGVYELDPYREGTREQKRIAFRQEFPKKLGKVMVYVMDAYSQRRSELNQLIATVTSAGSTAQ